MMSLITPDELQLYLLNQKNIEKIDLKNFALDAGLVNQVGKEFCLGQKIVPIEIQEVAGGRVLRFAFYSVNELPGLKKHNELQRFKLIPYLAQKDEIESLLKILESSDKDIRIYTSADSTRHVRVLNALVKSAVQARVSDILFELKEGQLDIFFRNGEQLSRVNQPVENPREFFEKIKEICGFRGDDKQPARESWLNLSKNFSHLKTKVLYYSGGSQENIRFRFHNLREYAKKIADLNLERDEVERCQSILQKPSGLFVVAGPAHNHTAETMYALMNSLSGERIATVETDVVLRNERFFQIENQGGDVSDAVYKSLLVLQARFHVPVRLFPEELQPPIPELRGDGQAVHRAAGLLLRGDLREAAGRVRRPPFVPGGEPAPGPVPAAGEDPLRRLQEAEPAPGARAFQEHEAERRLPGVPGGGLPQMPVQRLRRRRDRLRDLQPRQPGALPLPKSQLNALDRKISEAGNLTIAQKVLNRVLKGEVSYKESGRFF